MNRDARITLYGGAAVSLGMVGFGMLTNGLIALTGWCFVLVTLGLMLFVDAIAPADPDGSGGETSTE